MDTILFDELLQEIFLRLPPPSSATLSLVSKRWLRLFRSSLTSLSLRLPIPTTTNNNIIPSLSSFLSDHPLLTSLSLSLSDTTSIAAFSDYLLFTISNTCPNLHYLRFLTAAPVSLLPLLSLSTSCPHLNSLTINLSRPLSLHWLLHFLSLKHLSLICTSNIINAAGEFNEPAPPENSNSRENLRLETISLTGTRAGDYGLGWLWMNCRTVKKLRFRSCEGVGDNSSFSNFIKTLTTLQEVELRTCRPILDLILLNLAENCSSLTSLLVYDGGSHDGLLQFIRNTRCSLRKLDFRLPLDLDNNHLLAIAAKFRGLLSLRLESSCLVTGEGLKTLGIALGDSLEELALINCDVIERENGLLTTLGQSLKKLRKLDLSYNDLLMDKQFISMMASCQRLRELNLRGCSGLTNASLVSVFKNCRNLECMDIMQCSRINGKGIELFVLNCSHLRKLEIEDYKLS